ncbi:MAG: hypothetical protein Q7S45_02180 [Candidatus Curtissbacteria bacterium]|nr:hypothetical protein [Candidatus Curtissbacteria bacterium]
MSDDSDYKSLLSDLIRKQMVMLGPAVALSKARKVTGLSVDESGEVSAISGDPQEALKALAGEYMALSGQIAQMTLDSLLEKYPGIKKQNS